MSKDEVLFSEYKKSFNRYAEFFGVKNYEIFFLIDKDDAGRGRIEVNYQDKMANVCLCNGALVGNEKDIDKVAFHEAAELFCFEHFSHYLDDFDRLGNSKISFPATHSVIRFLENELYTRIRR